MRRCGEARRPSGTPAAPGPLAPLQGLWSTAPLARIPTCPRSTGAVVHSPTPSTAPGLPRRRAATWITPRLRGGLRALDLRSWLARVRLPDEFSSSRSTIQYTYHNSSFLLTPSAPSRPPRRPPAAISSPRFCGSVSPCRASDGRFRGDAEPRHLPLTGVDPLFRRPPVTGPPAASIAAPVVTSSKHPPTSR